jgi:hypothetical protein
MRMPRTVETVQAVEGSAQEREVPKCAESRSALSPELREVPKSARSRTARDGAIFTGWSHPGHLRHPGNPFSPAQMIAMSTCELPAMRR